MELPIQMTSAMQLSSMMGMMSMMSTMGSLIDLPDALALLPAPPMPPTELYEPPSTPPSTSPSTPPLPVSPPPGLPRPPPPQTPTVLTVETVVSFGLGECRDEAAVDPYTQCRPSEDFLPTYLARTLCPCRPPASGGQ